MAGSFKLLNLPVTYPLATIVELLGIGVIFEALVSILRLYFFILLTSREFRLFNCSDTLFDIDEFERTIEDERGFDADPLAMFTFVTDSFGVFVTEFSTETDFLGMDRDFERLWALFNDC